MTWRLDETQDSILAAAEDRLAQDVFEGGVPTSKTVRRVGASVDPYVVVNFADVVNGTSFSFAGVRGDDYVLPVNFMCVGDDPRAVRKTASVVMDVMLGFEPLFGNPLYKRPGGGVFGIFDEAEAVVAFVSVVSLATTIQVDV